MTPPTTADAHVVEGSEGLLLEIDGQIVPNYDATMVLFEEGDVVTGAVVRIDKDEVLVDIGYKSEGVIPNNELSIRKSVDPHDEVEMGEEVDALEVLGMDTVKTLIAPRVLAFTIAGVVLQLILLLVTGFFVWIANTMTLHEPFSTQITAVGQIMNPYDLGAAIIKNTILGLFKEEMEKA